MPPKLKKLLPNLYAVIKKDIEMTEAQHKDKKYDVIVPHPVLKRSSAEMVVIYPKKKVLLESGKKFGDQTFVGVVPSTRSILVKKTSLVLKQTVIVSLPPVQFFNILSAMADGIKAVREELLNLPKVKS